MKHGERNAENMAAWKEIQAIMRIARECERQQADEESGRKEAIPRHTEIKKHLARSICRNLSVPVPSGD